MTVTSQIIARLRRLTNEAGNSAVYTDDVLSEYIAKYPVIDSDGFEIGDPEWEPVYDLNAAAGDIWEEKAASVAARYNFSSDGGSHNVEALYAHALNMANHFRGRKQPKTVIIGDNATVKLERELEGDYETVVVNQGSTL